MLLWVGTNTERHVSSLGSDETMSSQREATRAVNGDAQQTFELAEDLWPYLQLSIVDTNAVDVEQCCANTDIHVCSRT